MSSDGELMKQGEAEHSHDASAERSLLGFHHKMKALASLAETQLKHAKQNQDRDVAALEKKIDENAGRLTTGNPNLYEIATAVTSIVDAKRALEPLRSFPQEVMLAETIFTSIFSSFDAYLNQLL